MDKTTTMTVLEAAQLLAMHPQTLRIAIEKGQISWATCIRAKRKRFIIYRKRFETETGIKTEQEETK